MHVNGEALFELKNGVEVQIDQPVDAVAADFPELEQRVHIPPVLEDPMELMAADETIEDTILERPQEPPAGEFVADATVAEATITMPTKRGERRYPSRTTRTSYKDERVYNMNLKTALNRHGKKTLRSIYLELMQMPERQVFTPQEFRRLTKAQLREVISSSMFLKEKFLSNGDFGKLKARLVGGGHQQDKSKYEDILSPKVATSAVFIIASLAAREARNLV